MVAEAASGLQAEYGITLKKLTMQLGKAEARMISAAKKAEKAWQGSMRGVDNGLTKNMKDAEKSAAVFERRIAQLERKFNPAAAQSRALQEEIDELNAAFTLGVVSLDEYNQKMGELQSAGEATDGMRDAAESAQVLQNELDDLTARFNPTAAAANRMAQEIQDLARAKKLGVVNSKQYQEALVGIRARYAATSTAARGMQTSFLNLGAGGIRNVSLQLSQVAQQGAITGDYFRALAFQIPDLAIGFGTLAVAGGAVLGVLAPMVLDMIMASEETKTFEDALSDATAALAAADAAIDDLADSSLQNLIEKYGTANRTILALTEQLARDAQQRAAEGAQELVKSLSGDDLANLLPDTLDATVSAIIETDEEGVQDIRDQISALRTEIENAPFVIPGRTDLLQELEDELALVEGRVDDVSDAFGDISVPVEVAARVRELVSALQEAAQLDVVPPDQFEAIADQISELREILDGLGGAVTEGIIAQLTQAEAVLRQNVKEAEDLARATGDWGSILDQGRSILGDVYKRLSDAAGEADKVREEIGDAATQALILAGVDITSGISDAAKEAAILAGNLGIALDAAYSLQNARSSKVYSGRGGDPRKIEATGSSYQSDVNYTPIDEQIADFEKSQRAGGSKGKSDAQREREELLREAQQLYRETRTEAEEYAAAIDRLDEIEKALTATERESVEWIETKQRALDNLQAEYEATARAAEFLEDTLGNAFLDAIENGGDLESVVNSIAVALRRAALEAAFFGEGPFAGLFGGSGSGIFGGLSDLLGFQSGGYTGDGSDSDVAGVVHKKEYVFNAAATARLGRKALERLASGQADIVDGGDVSEQTTPEEFFASAGEGGAAGVGGAAGAAGVAGEGGPAGAGEGGAAGVAAAGSGGSAGAAGAPGGNAVSRFVQRLISSRSQVNVQSAGAVGMNAETGPREGAADAAAAVNGTDGSADATTNSSSTFSRILQRIMGKPGAAGAGGAAGAAGAAGIGAAGQPAMSEVERVNSIVMGGREMSSDKDREVIERLGKEGFMRGGFTGNVPPRQVAGVVHGQEYVFDADATRRIGVRNLDRLASGGDLSRNTRVAPSNSAMAAATNEMKQASMAAGVGGQQPINFNPQLNMRAIIVDSAAQIGSEWSRTPQGERDIMAVVDRNRGPS